MNGGVSDERKMEKGEGEEKEEVKRRRGRIITKRREVQSLSFKH